jgi:hypothetical protein
MQLGLLPAGVTTPVMSAARLASSRCPFGGEQGMRSGIATTLSD